MLSVWILIILGSCSAEIYELNDTEYSRLPPLWSLEPYAACVEAGGTYCVLQLHLTAPPHNQLMHTMQEYSAHFNKHYNHTLVDRGVCVETSCGAHGAGSTGKLRAPLEACSGEWARAGWGLGARVLGVHCTRPAARAHPAAWDWAVLAGALLLAALNAASTLYDYFLNKDVDTQSSTGNKYLLSFSVSRNWKRLTNISFRDPKSQDLQFLHGARVISQLCTILMHVLVSMTIGFMSNPHDIEKTFSHMPYYLMYNGLMIVQIFFFISGFLTCYIAMQAAEQNPDLTVTVWDLPKVLILRLSRLFPANAVTVALVTSWLRHLGSGPLWQLYVTNSLVADCRTNWWRHLLFINNYTHQGNKCLLQTWHLAADMQVFVVALFAYIVSRRLLLPTLLLLSVLAPAAHILLQDLDPILITPELLRTFDSASFWALYTPGHTNLSHFILGMMTASKLYEWKKRGGHLVTSKWWSLLQYLSVGLIPSIMLTGAMFYRDGPRATLLLRALYSSLVRVALSGVCALAAFAFINRTSSGLKSLFEWRGWVVPSRLTYCVFLLHMPAIHMMMGYRTELEHYSFYTVLLFTGVITAVTLPAAAILHLAVEAPFIALFKAAAKLDFTPPPPPQYHTGNGKTHIKGEMSKPLYMNEKDKHL